LIKHQYNVLKRFSHNIYKLETTDSLTGTHNKTFLFEEGKKFISQHPKVCLMMLDVDHFEWINEEQGHMIADHVLQLIGQFLTSFFPQKMMVVRFVGKKFTILIPDCTLDKGKAIAENVRRKIMELKPECLDVTVSIGLTSSEGAAKTSIPSLISDADRALLAAHKQGYNRTCLCLTNKNIRTA
jgi:diguanylate cyclase (GGDEF)-like protein